jgi:hypothetical protein
MSKQERAVEKLDLMIGVYSVVADVPCRKYTESEFKKIVEKWNERRKKKEGKKNRVGC